MLLHIDEFRLLDAMWDLNYSGELDARGLYDLVLAATQDKEKADRMSSQRAMSRMRAGLEP